MGWWRCGATGVTKFARLCPRERRLLLSAAVMVAVVRAGLWVVPFTRLRETLKRFVWRMEKRRRPVSVERVVWTVQVASRYVPAATCLTQALAAQVLLGREGYESSLRLGVARGERGKLQAHAWVECQGKVVIGQTEALPTFTPLPPL